jgi:hypothetical protein
MKRNGEVIKNPIATLLLSSVVTYSLDPNGNIIEIKGFEEFVDGISKQVPPQVFQQLTPMINIETLKAKEITEWNGRIGDYLGAKVRVGDTITANSPYQLPDGSTINYNISTNITAIEPCARTNCVRIKQTYDSQADNLAKMSGSIVNKMAKSMATEIQTSSSESNSAHISGSVKRLVDPKTMLIHEEESKRIIVMKINAPGIGIVPMKVTETRLYEFQY